MLPFTRKEFFDVFERLNGFLHPWQYGALGAGAVAMVASVFPSPHTSIAAAVILAALWLITGVLYHLVFFRSINRAAVIFGIFFIIEAALLYFDRMELVFAREWNFNRNTGIIIMLYAFFGYPLIGRALGHFFPRKPVFGLTPCPLVIFTLGTFLSMEPVPLSLLPVPLAWSAIGTVAAIRMKVREDFGLTAAAILFLVLQFL